MNIEKITISNDPALYEAWPDVTCASDGTLVCVFSECSAHCFRPYTRIMPTQKTTAAPGLPNAPSQKALKVFLFFTIVPASALCLTENLP